jgi:hypothetical protein
MSAGEGGGEGGRGEGGNACVRADAFCGWRFEGGREVSSSARTGSRPLGRECFTPR